MSRPISPGQRGVVCEMNGNVALVLLESSEKETGEASSDKHSSNHALHWIQGMLWASITKFYPLQVDYILLFTFFFFFLMVVT